MANDSTSLLGKIKDNQSFPWHVHTYCIAGTIISIIGIFSNSLIIGATIRKGSPLRFKTNWLIFALALADLACNFSSIQIIVYFWIGWIQWTRFQCYYGAFTQIISITYEVYLIFAVALDRLLMLKYPVWYYNSTSTKNYLFKMIAPGFGLFVLLIVLGFLGATDNEKLILCNLPQAFGGPSGALLVVSYFILSFLVTSLNIWTFVLSRKQVVPSNATWKTTAAKMQRLSRSIIIVSVMFVSTFFLAVVVVVFVNIIKLPPLLTDYILYENGLFVCINFSVNGIIYGWRSGDYRNEYKKLLGLHVVTVAPVSTVAHNRIIHGNVSTRHE